MSAIIEEKYVSALISAGTLTAEDLEKARSNAEAEGIDLDQSLVRLSMVNKSDLMAAKASNMDPKFEVVDIANSMPDPQIARIIPISMAQRHKVVCIDKDGETLIVAMANPRNLFALDDIRLRTGYEVQPRLAYIDDVLQTIGNVYEDETEWSDLVDEAAMEDAEAEVDESAVEAPVVKLVNMIMSGAIKRDASDIHIESFEKEVIVRYRIDGVLHEIMTPPKALQNALISRVKIMSGLDIGEKRLPQDGRARIKVDETPFDLRISTLPTIYGESVVIRILSTGAISLTLKQLGFAPDAFEKFNEAISSPHGIILVTGPTGSGKSTTLYSALNVLNTEGVKICTIEDPVEYNLKGINQTQAHAKIGLTFSAGLRSFLRQDPDIILVGEIRDQETANIAMESALTGHLVLSTLHTNSAVGSITRLLDMKIEPFMISSSILGILAQRLLRRLCKECKEEITQPTKKMIDNFLKHGVPYEEIQMFRQKGCSVCGDTGYKGRLGVYEFMVATDEVRHLIVEGANEETILEAARRSGMKTLVEDAFAKAAQGHTSVDEVYRVLHG